MNKKVLFLASHFYPYGSIVEAKNNYLSVLELECFGYQVDVAAPVSGQKYPKNVKFLIKLHSQKSLRARITRQLRKLLGVPLMPIRFDNVSAFINELKGVDLTEYDYIYTVFGSGSEHIAGMKLLKGYPHLKWIAEFRDPWVHNQLVKSYVYDNSLEWYADFQWNKLAKTESKVLNKVDLLLVESTYHAELIKKDFLFEKEISVCNGYSDKLLPELPELSINFTCKPVIGFIGSTYYGYDDTAEIFIRALEELEIEGLEFVFVSMGNNAFSKLAHTSTCKNFYAFSKVPYPKSQAFIRHLTFGLAVTMKNYPNHVNSKIFEYMQYYKPTLAIAPQGGAMDQILTKTKSGSIIPYEKNEMKIKLREIIMSAKDVSCDLRPEQVKMYNRNEVFSDIVSKIECL